MMRVKIGERAMSEDIQRTGEDAGLYGKKAVSLSVNSWISIGFGTTSALGLLAFFLVLNTMSGSLDLAVSAIGQFWMWILPLTAGFGFQVGLFTYFHRLQKIHLKEKTGGAGGVAASGSASATAMAACCAHYLPALLPFAGVASAATVLGRYQETFFLAGILGNGVGIIHLLRHARRHGLAGFASGWLARVLRCDLESVFRLALGSSALILISVTMAIFLMSR